jgi:secreted trypsin-like serine protease
LGGTTGFGASGVVIAPNIVLTAAHIRSFSGEVFVGKDLTRNGVRIRVRSRHEHNSYNPSNKHENDLMVLILESNITDISPCRIAVSSLINRSKIGTVVGFGNTDAGGNFGFGKRRVAHVPIVSTDCSGSNGGLTDTSQYGCHLGREIVAGKPSLGIDACFGDSGGPLYVNENGEVLLAGITSRNTNLALNNCGDGSVYVRVDKYYSWIKSFVASKSVV